MGETKQPYKYVLRLIWNRNFLFNKLTHQAIEYGICIDLVDDAIFDEKWDPVNDYNGSFFIKASCHPFLPCFIRNWRLITFGYHKKWDIEFRDNLVKFGLEKWKANICYGIVRTNWFVFQKWNTKIKNYSL